MGIITRIYIYIDIYIYIYTYIPLLSENSSRIVMYTVHFDTFLILAIACIMQIHVTFGHHVSTTEHSKATAAPTCQIPLVSRLERHSNICQTLVTLR